MECKKMRNRVIVEPTPFRFFKYKKTAIKHKKRQRVNRLIDLQGFFDKIIACFIFINIFAFC